MIESMLWMLRGIAELRRFFWAPETGVKIEVGGWDSFLSLSYLKWKNVMDAHEGHLLGDGTFEHQGQN